jgi:acetylglutamate/LysW-gamma-L-alpha-aminoadipate kinase
MNQQLVERLQGLGVNAVGLSGMDGRVWEGERKTALRSVEDGRTVIIRDDFTGTVDRVNTRVLTTLLSAGFVPVLSPPAIAFSGEPINVDADRAAAQTASAMGARALLLLSNVKGLLSAFPDESTLIPHISRSAIEEFSRFAEGRMKKKVLGAGEALDGGVKRVVIADARGDAPISSALAGAGTTFE